MFDQVTALRFDRQVTSGRTRPFLVTCRQFDGNEVEAVVKLSSCCDRGVIALISEALAAFLAIDLGLPAPSPLLVQITDEFVEAVATIDPGYAERILQSCQSTFGSTKIAAGYSTWFAGKPVTPKMLPIATSIFVFDALIENVDRRDSNPNCQYRGEELAIFDHEVAFATDLILGRRNPWEPRGLQWIATPGLHIFLASLRRNSPLPLEKIKADWQKISDQRLSEYKLALPRAWFDHEAAMDRALVLIKQVRDNIDGCLAEVERVLR